MEITQSQVEKLIDDVNYLEHESEALKYVIDSVPHQERPPEGRSIAETLLLLDHAQQNYYRPIVEEAIKSSRPINLHAYEDPEESFDPDEDRLRDIQKVLYKLAKHRVAFKKLIEDMTLIDWERELTEGRKSFTLFAFVRDMVSKERNILKNIAELILTYQNSKQMQKEIQAKSESR